MTTPVAANPAINNTVGSTQAPAAATSSASSSSSTDAATTALNSDYSNFLKLLTTQLQNQDPTNPTDTNQLTQQIATLSEVEQQINTNKSLQQLVSLYNASQVTNAVSYIGKEVQASGNQSELKNGQAVFNYNLPATATSATVTITDSTGKTVFSGAGTIVSGSNRVEWDGTTTGGATAPDGTYSFAVAAKDANGNAIAATTYTTGTVQSVDSANGSATLDLGNNLSIPIANVVTVSNAS